jgi:hypothetical protein
MIELRLEGFRLAVLAMARVAVFIEKNSGINIFLRDVSLGHEARGIY